MKSPAYIAGFVVGMIFSIFIVYVILKHCNKDKKLKGKYDERQELLRDKGYKYSFFAFVFELFLCFSFDLFEINIPIEDTMLHFMIICFPILIFAGYCIWNEAYFALNENIYMIIVLFAFAGIINFIGGINAINRGDAIKNGILTEDAVNLVCGFVFLVVFCELLIKKLVSKKEQQ